MDARLARVCRHGLAGYPTPCLGLAEALPRRYDADKRLLSGSSPLEVEEEAGRRLHRLQQSVEQEARGVGAGELPAVPERRDWSHGLEMANLDSGPLGVGRGGTMRDLRDLEEIGRSRRPFVGFGDWPVLSIICDASYSLVSANRHRLSRLPRTTTWLRPTEPTSPAATDSLDRCYVLWCSASGPAQCAREVGISFLADCGDQRCDAVPVVVELRATA